MTRSGLWIDISYRSISFYLLGAERPWILADRIEKLVKLSDYPDFRLGFFFARWVGRMALGRMRGIIMDKGDGVTGTGRFADCLLVILRGAALK